MPMDLRLGDVVRLKKPHPCGSYEWEITRLGADIGLRCNGCGRRVMLARSKAEKRIKSVVERAESGSTHKRTNDGQTTGDRRGSQRSG
jgi:hypothetical protein